MEKERLVLSLWGTEEETIIKTQKGIFIVQSPDLGDREYEEISDIPEGFKEIVDGGYDVADACPDEIF